MLKIVKPGVIFGLVGGFFSILFGGWAVAVVGCLMGAGLGLSLDAIIERKKPANMAVEALPAAVVSSLVLLAISLLENYTFGPAIGRTVRPISLVLPANLIAVFGGIILTLITIALHGLPERQERIGKIILLALFVVSFPTIDNLTSLHWIAQIILALIFVILGMGLNIVVGYAGLLDLGYAAFFAIGAYTVGILDSPQNNIYLNFWLVVWIAAGMAAVFGLILGAPTLRLRGDYLAIVTLGFGEIIPVVFRNLTNVTIREPLTCWIIPGLISLFGGKPSLACLTLANNVNLTNGELGINPVGRPALPGFIEKFTGAFVSNNPSIWYFLIIVIILLIIFLNTRLRESRMGRAWMAIREDELAASQMGIDPVKTKLLAFAMGASFSGFAGAFYAVYIAGVFPGVFEFSTSIIILCIVILGGIGNFYGVIVGALTIMTADRLFLPALKDVMTGLLKHTLLPALASNPTLRDAVAQNANPILYRYFLFGITLVLMMAVRPEGLIPNAQRKAELLGDVADVEPTVPEAVADAKA